MWAQRIDLKEIPIHGIAYFNPTGYKITMNGFPFILIADKSP